MMEDLCCPFGGITKDEFDGREANAIQTRQTQTDTHTHTHTHEQTDKQTSLYYLTITVHIIIPEVLIHDGGPVSSIWWNN